MPSVPPAAPDVLGGAPRAGVPGTQGPEFDSVLSHSPFRCKKIVLCLLIWRAVGQALPVPRWAVSSCSLHCCHCSLGLRRGSSSPEHTVSLQWQAGARGVGSLGFLACFMPEPCFLRVRERMAR